MNACCLGNPPCAVKLTHHCCIHAPRCCQCFYHCCDLASAASRSQWLSKRRLHRWSAICATTLVPLVTGQRFSLKFLQVCLNAQCISRGEPFFIYIYIHIHGYVSRGISTCFQPPPPPMPSVRHRLQRCKHGEGACPGCDRKISDNSESESTEIEIFFRRVCNFALTLHLWGKFKE